VLDGEALMKLALRELHRRPNRFIVATLILLLLALLLMFLGGLIDGLIGNSTGAVRAQRADLVVFSSDAKNSFLRSRVDPDLRARIEAVRGVEKAGGIGIIQLGARVPGKGPRDLADTALFGYELAPKGVPESPPPLGEVYADDIVRANGITQGMTIELGAYRSPVTVIGFVSDTNYLGQGALWGSAETWRKVAGDNQSVQQLGEGSFQSLVVQTSGSVSQVRDAIDAATQGATATLTVVDAANAIPGVKEQRATFNQIIGVTGVIALVVVALFFALLTVERAALYGVLKAIGAGSSTLFAGVVVQAVIVTLIAAIGAALLSFALDALIPPGSIPFEISMSRVISSTLFLLFAAVVGCAFSLRRVLRIEPASAIGGSW
jgi:putative ABC transport system permease protein